MIPAISAVRTHQWHVHGKDITDTKIDHRDVLYGEIAATGTGCNDRDDGYQRDDRQNDRDDTLA